MRTIYFWHQGVLVNDLCMEVTAKREHRPIRVSSRQERYLILSKGLLKLM